jgi:hypothetical protein
MRPTKFGNDAGWSDRGEATFGVVIPFAYGIAYNNIMNTKPSPTLTNGTKVVMGLILGALLLVVGARMYQARQQDVMGVMQQQGPAAARQGIGLSQEGVKLLPREEQQELGKLYDEALQNLHPEEKQRFLDLAKKGSAASDQEIAESSDLIQRALRMLPQEKTERLLNLIGKAVQLQLAQQQSPPVKAPE